MPSDRTIWFATENQHKYAEAQATLAEYGVRLQQLSGPKIEIQSCNLNRISSFAADQISRTHKGLVIVEDSGLFVTALRGFPGPFSAYVHRTIGSRGILRLMTNEKRRDAYFQASVAVSKSGLTLQVFTGRVHGRISWRIRGNGGFGFDPIFVPQGTKMTFGEMDDYGKRRRSHRSVGFKKLASWFLSTRSQTQGVV